jgi:hypothetical protein
VRRFRIVRIGAGGGPYPECMTARRAFFYWQFLAAVLLPLWVLIGRGFFGAAVGWQFLVLLVLMPLLSIAMFAVGGVTAARKDVRTNRAVAWLDVAVIGAWHLTILSLGFFLVDSNAGGERGSSAFTQLAGADAEPLSSALANVSGALVVLFAAGAFWLAVWQFVRETRARVKGAIEILERDARWVNPEGLPSRLAAPEGPAAGRVIRIDPPDGPPTSRS